MRRAVQPVAGTDTNFGRLSVYVQLFRFSGNVFGGLIVNAVLGAVISEVLLRTLLFILIGKAPLRIPITSFCHATGPYALSRLSCRRAPAVLKREEWVRHQVCEEICLLDLPLSAPKVTDHPHLGGRYVPMLRLGLIQLDVVLRFLKCMHKMELEQAKKTVRPLSNSL